MGESGRRGEHAVVIGASMGGLSAARALSEFYDRVTLLERDTLPAPGENRRGAPQGRHAHVLLAHGREILEHLFPGLTEGLLAEGATLGDTSERVRRFIGGGYHRRVAGGIESLSCSRPLLEAHVRARVLALPNVRVIQGADARGLAATSDSGRVTGVRWIDRAGENPREEVIGADLVVDASGRGSRAPAWLEELGYSRPDEDRVRVQIGYTTRLYRRRPDQLDGDLGALITAEPPATRAGAILPLEGDRWMVSLCGYLGDYAPTDEAGFLAFARSLGAPDIYEVIKGAEPLGEVAEARFPASTRRRYERLRRFPEGYLVFGDAICSFNPLYGQGMTVAAMEAVALQGCLAEGGERLAPRFFREAGRLVDVPWHIVVRGDLRFPAVDGRRTWVDRFANWYLAHLHVAARRSARAALVFDEVTALRLPPSFLLDPRIVGRVLLDSLGGGGHALPAALPAR